MSAESRLGLILSYVIDEIACCVRCEMPAFPDLADRLSGLGRRMLDIDGASPIEEVHTQMLDLAAEVYEASVELCTAGWVVGSLALEGVEGRLIERLIDSSELTCRSSLSGVRVLTGLKERGARCRTPSRPAPGGKPWVQKRSSN